MERKFHGKRIDNGEWIEGDLYQSEEWYYEPAGDVKKYRTYIIPKALNIDLCHDPEAPYSIEDYEIKGLFEVLPESVGQHTGREDIHDTAIWDGSFVTGLNLKGCHAVVWDEYYHGFRLDTGMCLWELEKPEVVGNITDNPELLEDEL